MCVDRYVCLSFVISRVVHVVVFVLVRYVLSSALC